MQLRCTALVIALAVALVCVPGAAMAADVQPQAIDDPPAAFAQEEEPAAPVTPAPVQPDTPVDPAAEPVADAPVASIAAGGAASIDAGENATATVAIPVGSGITTGSGSLPFTGVEIDRNSVMFALGLLLVLGGSALFAVPAERQRSR